MNEMRGRRDLQEMIANPSANEGSSLALYSILPQLDSTEFED